MSFEAQANVIRQRFEALWPGAVSPAVLHTYGDVRLDPPNRVPWVRLSVLSGETRQASMGAATRLKRTVGVVVVDIFVPAGDGDGLARRLGDLVADIFELRTVSGVVFRATTLERVGPDGPWLQWSASTPYQADSLRALP